VLPDYYLRILFMKLVQPGKRPTTGRIPKQILLITDRLEISKKLKSEISSVPQKKSNKRWNVFVAAPQGADEKTNKTIPTPTHV